MSKHVVVIGAVALGPKAACRFKRLEPDARVTMIDQSPRISYGGCGIPYFVSGEVNNIDALQATPYNVVRDPDFFRINKGVDVLTETRAVSIDRAAKTVQVEHLRTGEQQTLSYDKLVLALGSRANRPPVEGLDLGGVTAATNLEEAELIRNAMAAGTVSNAVIVGGGFIGLEMAVALADMWGIGVTVVELADRLMPGFLSSTLTRMVRHDLEKNGVTVLTGEKVVRLEGEDGTVARVVTDKRTIDAELVIMAAGVSPNTAIAKAAGLDTDPRGALIVNDRMQTSDPDIYSGGDCVTIPNLVTGKPGFFPLGSMANRQGRVVGTNLAGGNATFPGAVGSWVVKLFEISACGAGLTIETALREGYDAINVHVEQFDRAHFFPEKTIMSLELVVEKATRRVLGIQGVSTLGDALTARINAVATMLADKPTIEDISNAEIVYSPPFASAMDILNVVGNVAENILEGRARVIDPEEFERLWNERDTNDTVCFIDTRLSGNAVPFMEKYPDHWKNIPEEQIHDRLGEVPTDRTVVLVCNTGLRAYDAQLMLAKEGMTNTVSVQGGMVAMNKIGADI
ncbi:FAD-dependent oxidoreductase [Nitratidesulfovibrio sp.]|uniref:FAD-dependent oxidoreductase n=1 Tax=Nitratidesulfovibrio sp. TaxID=2802297 RepID=UPI003340FF88